MATELVTVNVPKYLEEVVERQWQAERYLNRSDYVIGLILWDIYSRQPHKFTGTLLREPTYILLSFVRKLLAELREPAPPVYDVAPWRVGVYVPVGLIPLIKQRRIEEGYRSQAKYLLGLILYDLKFRAPDPKKIPHHKTSPLMREPDIVQQAVIAQLAADFDNPERVWPKGIEGRIAELIARQRELPLDLPKKQGRKKA